MDYAIFNAWPETAYHLDTRIMSTTLAVLLALLLLPLIVLLWATESRHTRIQRLRRNGHTWKQIAHRYNCSPTTARRWATA